jgi:hypothetical protein
LCEKPELNPAGALIVAGCLARDITSADKPEGKELRGRSVFSELPQTDLVAAFA